MMGLYKRISEPPSPKPKGGNNMKQKTEAKHTPGLRLRTVGSKAGNYQMQVESWPLEESEATKAITLYLAAPDLLEAANGIVAHLQAYNRITGKGSDKIASLIAAILKAEGGK